MTHRFSWLRFAAAACVAGTAFAAVPAHAGIFDDDQARQAILDLRSKTDSLSSQLSAAQRTILDQSNRLDQLNQQVATLRGQNEDMGNQLATLQKQQKDYYTDLDTQYWLGNALYALRDYKGSTATWQGVVKNYPQHPRAPEALLAIANNQLEQGQKAAAKKTLEQIVAQYGGSDVAQSAQSKLSQIK
jgi:tol-pal system protein YbgF